MTQKVMRFNPYTGQPRDPRDIASDPEGLLMVAPGKTDMLAAVVHGCAVVPNADKDQATRQKVEILFNGVRRLVFVNGRQVRQVLSIETPRSVDEMAGIVELKFIASEIVEREISREQFDALMKS
jgi:hypothetical protein